MGLYGGIDLHSSNNYLGIINDEDKRVFKKKLYNRTELILKTLEPYRKDLVGIVVESTFNWYWLVDLLMDEGYRVHLANPSAIKKYEGLKHSDDNDDAFWLAHLLRLGILPEGYIYPKEERPVRDLLRKRSHLVKLRTSLILSLQGIISRNCGFKMNVNKIKKTTENEVYPVLLGQEDLELSGEVSKETIDFLTRRIRKIETFIQNKIKLKEPFKYLQTISGIGKVLSLTIMLETGPIDRFPKVGNYVSYCRKVPTGWTSNGKKKGKGNKKNGNRYLAWAYSEAAELARRYDKYARAYYNRKTAKTNFMVAHSALAHKLARAAYYVMKDCVPFDHQKVFV
ncbi:MAG: IS110 family transposase [Deltaproteobacteria bacterium]|nr:IS110 family transposase [Deltaproteobacteria bacterium]